MNKSFHLCHKFATTVTMEILVIITPLQACSYSWDREPLRNTNTSTKWVNGLKSSNIRLIHDYFSAGKPIPVYLPFST